MPSRRPDPARPVRLSGRRRLLSSLGAGGAAGLLGGLGAWPGLAQADWPITPQQRARARQTAEAGVPLSELAPNAPDRHVVQRGDTLWGISGLFLRRPWRWPELWGMNLEQIRNPHLIYPGQVLVLDRSGGRARLRMGEGPAGTVKLSPRVRSQVLSSGAIASVPLQWIGPFLNDAVVLERNELAQAARIVASQEDRVLLSKGETAYVRGDLAGARSFAVFREARPLKDPQTQEVLGYEAGYVGTAELVRPEGVSTRSNLPVPATVVMTGVRQEAGVGDRLVPVPPREFEPYMPHGPEGDLLGQVVSIYGEAMTAGQNQIVAINRGQREGIERGHVLALWRAGAIVPDRTAGEKPQPVHLPDERNGLLFVFRVFDRVSYALIASALDPVRPGDWFTQP